MALTLNEILIRMIKSIDLFNSISDEECIELSKDFSLQYYPRWTIIIREWHKPEKIYILKNGKLEARKSNGLWSVKLWDINPGQIFWEISYLRNKSAMASVISIDDSDVWELSIDHFDKFLKKYPNIMDKVMETLVVREKQNSTRVIEAPDSDDILDNLKIVL